MLNALDVSTSGLVAQRLRMNAISSNLANLSTTHNEEGEPVPYQPRYTIFETDESVGSHGGAGVRVRSVEIDDSEPRYRHQPHHPDAIKEGRWKGYVAYPNVNMMLEFTDALEAARAYEANLGAIDITKTMAHETLRILV